jgi:hypothetical protein
VFLFFSKKSLVPGFKLYAFLEHHNTVIIKAVIKELSYSFLNKRKKEKQPSSREPRDVPT